MKLYFPKIFVQFLHIITYKYVHYACQDIKVNNDLSFSLSITSGSYTNLLLKSSEVPILHMIFKSSSQRITLVLCQNYDSRKQGFGFSQLKEKSG